MLYSRYFSDDTHATCLIQPSVLLYLMHRAVLCTGAPAQIWAGRPTTVRFDLLQPSHLDFLSFFPSHGIWKKKSPTSRRVPPLVSYACRRPEPLIAASAGRRHWPLCFPARKIPTKIKRHSFAGSSKKPCGFQQKLYPAAAVMVPLPVRLPLHLVFQQN